MRRNTLISFAAAAAAVVFTLNVEAQATRTWVSGVGDDVNPCSRTAPCKTWAGAISKTAAGGEINALDSGGFGTLTITKSITIDGSAAHASTLNSGGINAFVINDSATATPGTVVVTIRNVAMNGAGTTPGLNGIRFISGRTLHVENCFITGNRSANGRGISVSLSGSATADIFVRNTTITNNAGLGIGVTPSSGTPIVRVHVERSAINQNLAGIGGTDGAIFTLSDTVLRGNSSAGVDVAGSIIPTTVMLDNCHLDGNGRGIQTAGGAVVRVGRSSITNNITSAINIVGGSIFSFGDNYVAGNGGAAAVFSPISKQ